MKRSIRLLSIICLMLVASLPVEANILKKGVNTVKKGAKKVEKTAKSAVKSVEHTLGWDRYILCWGDRLVPPDNRWVAIRSSVPRHGDDIGKFWDVPGDGDEVKGPNKDIKLWEITFQEYPKADRRYRFVPVYETTKNPDDFDYYWIQSKTGMWVQAKNKGEGIILNSGYNTQDRTPALANPYQWKIKNVGNNKFTIVSRLNDLAIDAQGGAGDKNGTIVQLWEDQGQAPVVWEFVYIAEGDEVKTTGEMAQKRVAEVQKMTKQVTDVFGGIAEKVGDIVAKQAKKAYESLTSKKLIDLTKKSETDYTLRVGFPEAENPLDVLKEKTVEKYFKIDLKKIVFTPVDGKNIAIGLINRIECMGHSVDLSFEFLGDWSFGKEGFKINNFKLDKFKLPLLPGELADKIKESISKYSKKISVKIDHIPGMDKITGLKNARSDMKIKDFKKGSFGFETTMTL